MASMQTDEVVMGKILAVFANKGGVGKTTIVRELLSRVIRSKEKLKVLFLDADPQMNLSSVVISEFCLKTAEKFCWMKMIKDFTGAYKPYNIFNNEGVVVDIMFPMDEDDEIISNLSGTFFKDRLPQFNVNLDRLFNRFRCDYDFVIIDLSPSLGVINKSILASCDSLISCVLSDEYSKQGLIKVRDFITSDQLKNIRSQLRLSNIKWLGLVMSMTFSKDGLNNPEAHYKRIFEEVLRVLNVKLIGFLPKISDTDKKSMNANHLTFGDGGPEKVKTVRKAIDDLLGMIIHNEIKEIPEIKEELFLRGGNHFVYLIKEEGGDKFKIGKSSGDLKSRVSQLQVGNPRRLVLVFTSIDLSNMEAFSIEGYLHRQFSKTSAGGEWFKLTENDVEQIQFMLTDEVILKNIIENERIIKNIRK